MDIIWLLYGLTVIPVAGVILSVVMLFKDFRGYRKAVLKKSLITALIALLLLGGSLLPDQSGEAYVGFVIVGLPLTILGPGGGFGWHLWMIETVLVWLNWFGICSFFTTGVKLLAGRSK